MAKIYNLPSSSNRDPEREKIRADVADFIQMLTILKEKALGRPVCPPDLLPIDLRSLAAPMGLRIEEVDELDGTGSENLWTERDTKVAGLFNRETRTITLTKSESPVQRRFTLAHEFAHAIYHCDPLHLRQRVARASSGNPKAHLAGRIKDPEERKADIFAAELLMPMEFVTKATIQRFGASIDMTVPRDDLAHYLSSATKRKIEPRRLAEMPQYDRALLFTEIKSFHGKEFVPLVELFDVSVEAMAIRLLELGLVN